MTETKQYQPPYTLVEIEEMGKLIDAERYAEYHAYNWRHRRRQWSRHAANIAAGYGPDAAYVRAYLHSYFEGKLTESERRNMSAKIARRDFENIKDKDGVIPNDRDAVKDEVVWVMEEKLKLPKESFPGTLTYGEMVGEETSDNAVNREKVETATLAGLAAMLATPTEPPAGAVVDEHGVITNRQGEFVGIKPDKDDVTWFERQALSYAPVWALRTLDEMHGNADLPRGPIGVPMWDIYSPSEKDVGPGAAPPLQPPFAAPEIEDSLVAPPAPQSMSAPVEDDEASEFDLPIPAPSPTPGEVQEIAAPMPDPLHALLPGLDLKPAIELPAGATVAPADGTDVTAPQSAQPTPFDPSLPLTPQSFPGGGGGGDTKLEEKASLPAVLPALDRGSTIDLGRADVDQIDAGQIADSTDADNHLIAASFDTPSVPVGALANAAATQSERPTSVTVGGRVYTREEVMAQTTISADGRRSTWTIPQPKPASEPPLTEKRTREIVWEELREWDRRIGANARSRGRFRYRG